MSQLRQSQEFLLIPEADRDGVLSIIAAFVWNWYKSHKDDVILKRKILVFNVTFKVKDMHFVLAELFGPEQY